MDENGMRGAVGLAMRAGFLKTGDFQVSESLKAGKALLVILAGDASDNTCKKIINSCKAKNVPCIRVFSKEELGRMTGKEYLSSAAVTDKGFAELIKKHL
ncbi:MAG: L7Ae/L30e/S12e/Gadd45 family ribosomal protein [Lachnospiraceae bacterium]|jgi:ribosomal protein L7Ae-like RNA K-turn-binding protein|nr:L7Ae/L30e/S12e/Gadd45 family ribosomal protein [Lachnospiraceae bacterium]MEE3460697.1 L7Ae/L30e/S12e/Gadd45 family ribosomal protein [Lachnospiraceae bacterium]